MTKLADIEAVRNKYELLAPVLDERTRRHWAASEAIGLGWGGVTRVSEATGLSRTTIMAGMKELRGQGRRVGPEPESGRVRRSGGGRNRSEVEDRRLSEDLRRLVESGTRGDPECPLLWTSKSTRRLAEELNGQGWRASHQTVASLLKRMGYSLQANRKTREGESHPDRDAQFEHIARRVCQFQRGRQPVVSVDTKKKELMGDFKNAGREWRAKGSPEKVRTHDFPDKELGKGIPYGVYDMTHNNGWVSVGIDHDTAEFATATIERWWREMGSLVYPKAKELLITADSGGSNGSRNRLWKVCLQTLADNIGLNIVVCHFPPGTSKWNKIEHRMFCHITKNWRGKPLLSHTVVVNLIANTKTRAGLRIKAALDVNSYQTGIKVSDEQLRTISIVKDDFHGDWNYTICARL